MKSFDSITMSSMSGTVVQEFLLRYIFLELVTIQMLNMHFNSVASSRITPRMSRTASPKHDHGASGTAPKGSKDQKENAKKLQWGHGCG